LHVSAHGTNHPAAVVSMPHKKVGFEELPTYASSWSPRSLAASGGVLALGSLIPGLVAGPLSLASYHPAGSRDAYLQPCLSVVPSQLDAVARMAAFVAGTTNHLLARRETLAEVVANVETGALTVRGAALADALAATIEDLRLAAIRCCLHTLAKTWGETHGYV
jgi:hypothetical protein